MAGIRWPPEDSELLQPRPSAAASDLVSDDDRSVAADSWSVKSDYGSLMDDDQRHADAAEVLSACNLLPSSDYSSDKEAPDAAEVEASILGLQSYWDTTYAEDLANFHEHGHGGETWFGVEVLSTVVSWTKKLFSSMSQEQKAADSSSSKSESSDTSNEFSSSSVLDIGTGNGLLLQELAKQGFSDLTGTDYCVGAIELAQKLADRDGYSFIKFLVDDILETKLETKYQLVLDKGALDCIGLHPDGPVSRMIYWESVSNLVAPGGMLVIASLNSTKEELLQEVENFNREKMSSQTLDEEASGEPTIFQYLDHLQTPSSIMFGRAEGSPVSIIAFLRN